MNFQHHRIKKKLLDKAEFEENQNTLEISIGACVFEEIWAKQNSTKSGMENIEVATSGIWNQNRCSYSAMNSSHANAGGKRGYDVRSGVFTILGLTKNENIENLLTAECIHHQIHHHILSEECSTQWYHFQVEIMMRSLNIHKWIKWKSMFSTLWPHEWHIRRCRNRRGSQCTLKLWWSICDSKVMSETLMLKIINWKCQN